MLAPAIQRGLLDLWDDNRIPPGAKWGKEIEDALASASIAVLLVSQNFLASHFIAENELPPLLAAAQDEGVTIFWFYLSSCLYEQTQIASYQAAHDISRPLDRLPKSQRQAVLSKACEELVRAAQNVASRRQPPSADYPPKEPTLPAPNVRIKSSQQEHDPQSAPGRPGAIDLKVVNAAKTDDGYDVAVDGKIAQEKVTSSTFVLLGLSPGLHKLTVAALIAGMRSEYSLVISIEPGAVSNVALTLPTRRH